MKKGESQTIRPTNNQSLTLISTICSTHPTRTMLPYPHNDTFVRTAFCRPRGVASQVSQGVKLFCFIAVFCSMTDGCSETEAGFQHADLRFAKTLIFVPSEGNQASNVNKMKL
jgi:hypothetical protein